MHNVPKFEPRIFVYTRGDTTWEFKNIRDAADWLFAREGFYSLEELVGRNWSDTFSRWEYSPWKRDKWPWSRQNKLVHYPVRYIVRSELGDVIEYDDLYKARSPRKPYRYQTRWLMQEKAKFRDGPVPCTGKRTWGHWLRHPKTTSERRVTTGHENDEDLLEYGVKIRGRRRGHNLPNAWDDIPRSEKGRSWKNYRKHQWKK